MAGGKYAHVLKDLPRSLGHEPEYQEKVNVVKAEVQAEPDGFGFRTAYGEPLTLEDIPNLLAEVKERMATVNNVLLLAAQGKKWAAQYARVYAELRKVKEVFEAEESEVNLLIAAYEQLVVDYYEVEGVSSQAVVGLGTVRSQPEPHAQVTDRDKFRDWCVENGLMRSLNLAWQTTNAMVKERLLAGAAPPPGVEATCRTKLVFTKEK